MSPETRLFPQVEEIAEKFAQTVGVWSGCDWPTAFGRHRLNLETLNSTHAVLMARATAGREADAWWEASRWLARVEQEARDAEEKANHAVQLARAGRWVEALTQARSACDIEARYHARLVWQPLREAIELALRTSNPK